MQGSTIFRILAVCVGGALLTGCVMSEKYEAEKARGLNFQRLLAQEEKRTAELDSEMKKVRREFSEMEARNRELSSELQLVRERLAQSQEETLSFQETSTLAEEVKSDLAGLGDVGALSDDILSGLGLGDPGAVLAEEGIPIYHEVLPGETLFRLARTYGVKVDKIKEWNSLPDDLIEVGQQLVVGYQ